TKLAAAEGLPDLVFSDEDMLIGGRPGNPYFRPGWDPILNLATSYVWHIAALKRATVLAVGCFTDPDAEYCHDWDTAMRLWQSGARCHHVPRILYHWRQHSASTSNTG